MSLTERFHMRRGDPRVGKQEKLSLPGLEIKALEPIHLIPIIEGFYGKKEWFERDEGYWKTQTWDYRKPNPIERGDWSFETQKYYQYLHDIVRWSVDPETRGHLDPAPGVPVYNEQHKLIERRSPNIEDPNEMEMAVADLAKYYFNEGEPQKIKPLMAFTKVKDEEPKLAAVLTLRWRGDKYVPAGKQKVASIERLIVDPEKRDQHIGLKLTTEAIEYAFHHYRGYRGEGAEEIRAWVMSDRIAGNYQINLSLFMNKLNFHVLRSQHALWRDYSSIIGEKTDREALWLSLKKEDWERHHKKGYSKS